MSAPWSNSSASRLGDSLITAAMYNGVHPNPANLSSTSAPQFSNLFASCKRLPNTALCNGVKLPAQDESASLSGFMTILPSPSEPSGPALPQPV